MRTRVFFIIGAILILIALIDLIFVLAQSSVTQVVKSTVPAVAWVPPEATATPVSGQIMPTPFTTPEATSTPRGYSIYTVQPGDELFRIALQYAASIQAIALANGIDPSEKLVPGQILVIPESRTVQWPSIPTITPTLSGTQVGSISTIPVSPSFTVTPTPNPALPHIEVFSPARVQVDHSASIRVKLVRVGERYISNSVLQSNTVSPSRSSTSQNPVLIATPFIIAVGTPDTRIANLYGPDYEAYCVARLASASIETKPSTSESQSLEQQNIIWVWNIATKNPGKQILDLNIEIQWKPKDGRELIKTYMIYDKPIEVEVEQPFVNIDNFTLGGIIVFLGGLGLSIPGLIGALKTWRRWLRSKKKKPQIIVP